MAFSEHSCDFFFFQAKKLVEKDMTLVLTLCGQFAVQMQIQTCTQILGLLEKLIQLLYKTQGINLQMFK